MSATAFQRLRREQKLKAKDTQENENPLDKLKVDELKAIAKEKSIEGYNHLKRAELLKALRGG